MDMLKNLNSFHMRMLLIIMDTDIAIIDIIENENDRKITQLLNSFKDIGIEELEGWRVHTKYTGKGRFYTTFSHPDYPRKLKSIKKVKESVLSKREADNLLECEKVIKELHFEEQCGICYGNHPECYKFPCGDYYCRDCMKNYFTINHDISLDVETGKPLCPDCKANGKTILMDDNILNELIQDGIIAGDKLDNSNGDSSLKSCGICYEDYKKCYKFHCGDYYCRDCLINYFTINHDAVLDVETREPRCPGCKARDKTTIIDYNVIEDMVKKGIIDSQTRDNLYKSSIIRSIDDDIYSCIREGCLGKWTLDGLPVREDTNKYEVQCPVCNYHQCCHCGIEWNRHNGINCGEKGADMDTLAYIQKNCIVCPGKCGQIIQKDEEPGYEYCNVLRCVRDKLYVCGLCGMRLDSKNFDVTDKEHVGASMHYSDEGPESCRGHLFTRRIDWLKGNTTPVFIPT